MMWSPMSWVAVLGRTVVWVMAHSARTPVLLMEIACAVLLILLLGRGRHGGGCLGSLAGVLVFTMRGELIQAVHVIGDPGKLDFLSSQLTTLA